MSSLIGYARTSTADQTAGLDDQRRILAEQGCARIYAEHISASAAKRPEFAACLGYLRDGDTLVVTKPDRLARSVRDMLAIMDELKARGVFVRILSMGIDTESATGKLTLTVLSAVAEMEREIMLERQKIGIAAAKTQGKYRGRKPKLTREQIEWAIDQIRKKRRRSEVCAELGCSDRTLYAATKAAQEGVATRKRKEPASAEA